jgi:hypothetical protein
MPIMSPSKLRQAGALANVGHAGEAEIDPIGKDGCEQRGLVLDRPAAALVREAGAEPCPGVNLDQQVGDTNARQ